MSSPDALLSYDEALVRILASVPYPTKTNHFRLIPDSAGNAIAEDIYAPENLPPFDNSAVDGYAIFGEKAPGESWPISRTIAAGDAPGTLEAGTAARIFTGAPVPAGADRIVMQEDTDVDGSGTVKIHAPGKPGDFIRRRGSDIAAGTLAVPAGTTVDAGVIGLLASLNVSKVPVPRVPRVGLVTTGDELVSVGAEPLQPGQIRNSNAPALWIAILESGGLLMAEHHARDSADAVREAFDACAGCDVILSCGGVSVGEHDYVKGVVEEMGTLDFWRIAIKPGKPLAFGRIGNALFFGLPGNPVSSLVTFELFVRPVMRKLAGHKEITRRKVSAVLDEPLRHASGRREFVRARLTWNNDTFHATITGPQDSHRLHSLLGADAYLIADEARGDYSAGERLSALLLA